MFCSLIKIKKSNYKKVYLNRDIFNIIIEYLIIDLYNETLNINNLKNIIKTNIKLDYIFNDIKYGNNVRNFYRILKLLEKYNYYNKDYEYYIGNKLVDNKKYIVDGKEFELEKLKAKIYIKILGFPIKINRKYFKSIYGPTLKNKLGY